MKVYLAGPYTASTSEQVDKNIQQAREVMAVLLEHGHSVYCPHSMTGQMERTHPEIDDFVYMESHMSWLKHCDAVVLLPGWERSRGSQVEFHRAQNEGVHVYLSLADFLNHTGGQ